MNNQKALRFVLLAFFWIVAVLIFVFACFGRYIIFDEPGFSASTFWFLAIPQPILLIAIILGMKKAGQSTKIGPGYTLLLISFVFAEAIILIFSLTQS